MLQHDQVLQDDLERSIDKINNLTIKTNIEKATEFLHAINMFLLFCLGSLVRNGKIKVKITDIPAVWRHAKKLVEDILAIFPERDIFKRLEFMPNDTGSVIIDYLIWCFQNIITADNKVKIPILKIIPFIIKTINLVKKITLLFGKKPL
jgi:hypothetical protein